MKYLKILMLVISMLSFQGNAQEKDVLPTPEFKAEPVGGMQNFYLTFTRKFNAPEIPINQNEIYVKLSFFIEVDGSLTEIAIEGETEEIRNEINRVMKLMPNWKPAMTNNEPVRSKFIMPIRMKVTKDNLPKN